MLCNQIADTMLEEKGHYVQAINYPTVAKGEERLRLAPTPNHSKAMIQQFAKDALDVFNSFNIAMIQPEKPIEISSKTILVN